MSDSTTRRLMVCRSTRRQKSSSETNGPGSSPPSRTATIASIAPSPTFLMAAMPKRIASGAPDASVSTVKRACDFCTSGGRTSIPRPPALGDDRGDLLGALAEAVEDGGHELDRVVRLEVGRLVRDQPVAGGVGLVEAVAGEGLELGEDLVDDVRRDALLLRAGLELRLVLAEDVLLLLADRVAEVVRLGTGVVRHRDGGGHDVLLVHEDPVRVPQRGLQGVVQVGHRLLAVLAADVGGDVRHRSRAEEGDHGGQVAHLGRLELLDVSAHAGAFQLEDAHRVAVAEQLERLRVVERQLVDVQVERPMRLAPARRHRPGS